MTATPTRPAIRWLLVGSLALNVMLVGIIGGAALSFRGGPPPGVELAMGPLARALDDEDRREIRREMMRAGLSDIPSRRDRSEDLAALVAALQQEPFNRDAVAAVLAEQSGRAERLATAARQALLDRIAAMTPEARQAFAARLAEETRHRGGGGG